MMGGQCQQSPALCLPCTYATADYLYPSDSLIACSPNSVSIPIVCDSSVRPL